jgi:hypothetical protein
MAHIGTWKAMPDPRHQGPPGGSLCRIQVRDHALWHLAAKHVAPSEEPWDQWLPADTIARIRDFAKNLPSDPPPDEFRPDRDPRLGPLQSSLEDQADWCLKAPLVVRILAGFPEMGPDGAAKDLTPENTVEKWIMVLPVGAVMWATVRDENNIFLNTCYFKKVTLGRADAPARCRRLLAFYVDRYVDVSSGALPVFTNRPLERNDGEEWTRLIAFVTYPNWGFDASPPHATVRPRVFYAYPLEAVPSSGEDRDRPSRNRRRLQPRRPPLGWSEEEDCIP